ncbi:MAG: hypothetical protein FJ216_08560 [Ignavibacteria bacterium]|nr:hypothetical protein [Ignavibacteria bacterium]
MLLIGFYSINTLKKGTVSWRGEHLINISEYTNIEELNIYNTPMGIGYLTGFSNISIPSHQLKICDIGFYKDSFKVNYKIQHELKYNAGTIKRAIREILSAKYGKLMNLPFCIALADNFLEAAVEDEELIYRLKSFQKNNDWLGIVKLFEPLSEIKDKPHIWNNTTLLNTLSFACAKLSEVYTNLRKQFPDENEKKKYLDSKKYYRTNVIEIRNRCILLNPENAGYYSNLGYTHYQHCLELTTPGGRRDGKILEEAQKALENLNNALELDPNRISDLYRKGQILTQIIPPNVLFGGKNIPTAEVINDIRKKMKGGIACFQKAESVYELIPLIDEKLLIRFKKEYIKSLYDIARAYNDLVIYKWKWTDYIENEINNSSPENSDNIISQNNLEYINKSIYYIEKCINCDLEEQVKKIYADGIILGERDGKIDGILKLYAAGKYYFKKYLILSENQKGNEAEEFRVIAEKYFKAALRCRFPKEKQSQSKNFIAERLSRLYITKKEYEKAYKTIEPYVKPKTDYYIRYTYAISAIKLGKLKEAKNQIELALKFEKFNKDTETGKKLLSLLPLIPPP